MSLHVTQAEALIHEQRRKTAFTSALITVLSIALLLLLLSLYLLDPAQTPQDDGPLDVVYREPQVTDPVPPREDKAKPAPTTPVALPPVAMPQLRVPTPLPAFITDHTSELPHHEFTPDFDADFTSGGFGHQGGFDHIPPRMKSRCSKAERQRRLTDQGGTDASEHAVVRALRWLKQTQHPDGGWGDKHRVAMTGLAVLTYLGHCETTTSAEFGTTMTRALGFLIDTGLRNDGKLWSAAGNPAVYEHGIATYALAEAYTFHKGRPAAIPQLADVLRTAGNRIIDGQAACGGWAYHYNPKAREGDNSVGYWQIQALKACKHTGLWPEAKFNRPIRSALDWLEQAQGDDGAIGYRGNPGRSPQLTAGGALAFQIWGHGDSKAARMAVDHVRRHTAFSWGTPTANLYYHYYNAQAMINAGGNDWNHYNRVVMKPLVDHQHADGSWRQTMAHGPVNTHMATCLAAMTLEAYYRFLPGNSTP